MGDSAREATDIASISDMLVILAGDTSFDFLTEVSVFEGVNVSGVSPTPWYELMDPVCTVRPRAK